MKEPKQKNLILALVEAQAEDEGLWFIAEDAPTAYLQQELRKLHAVIEYYFSDVIEYYTSEEQEYRWANFKTKDKE